ncbi:hypothetical protein PV328_000188 [Microctonus aethiopoides]|uniref:Uncharacterized protein n=1 Tax=Microctonus aethiopoides TaxID=144406 RepID=A0AA39FUQ0_9HYME|nr:hypothetical protein PV328_000188 [Microctonus aethiopoides]
MLQVHKGSKGCSLEPHWYIKSDDRKGIIVEEEKKMKKRRQERSSMPTTTKRPLKKPYVEIIERNARDRSKYMCGDNSIAHTVPNGTMKCTETSVTADFNNTWPAIIRPHHPYPTASLNS